MGDTKGANHVREHGSVLARVEKQALIWMAKRLPSWINSDHLTALGLLAMIVAGGAYWASAWSEATLLVVVGLWRGFANSSVPTMASTSTT